VGDAGCEDNRPDQTRAFCQGSIGEIPRDLKVSRNAVRKVLRSGGPCFRMSARFSRVPRWDAGKRS
jgi:hypothetical protein